MNEEDTSHGDTASKDDLSIWEKHPVYNGVCELLICDEAHKLKNSGCEMTKSLFALPAKKRILLSGTPMQNELSEFYNMVNFCNPLILGTVNEFRRR